MSNQKRVVVTGLGAVTPVGNNTNEFWEGLVSAKSSASTISRFDASAFRTRFACEIKGFDPLQYLDQKEVRSMDLYSQYAVASVTQAVNDSCIKNANYDPYRVGVIFASGIGGLFSLQEDIIKFGKKESRPRFSPHMITKMIPNMAAGIIAMRYDYRGPNYAIVSACASSSHAIIEGVNLIRLGIVDAVIVGGAEACINATALGGFSAMKAISERNEDPRRASRPLDQDRDGFVLGEGAGALVLESFESAQSRDANIYAEIAGYGMTADAYHYTMPHPEGRSVYQSMFNSLKDASIGPDKVDYINLHATSTPVGDLPELKAVGKLFRNNLDKIHVSATKSMTGHLLGGAGAIEAIASILTIKKGIVPPTVNTAKLDSKIDFDIDLTLHKAVKKDVNISLSNTFGFGGQNATIAFRKMEL